MKRLDFLTGNWGLKLLAFVLAIVLYHAVKQSSANSNEPSSNRHERIESKTP